MTTLRIKNMVCDRCKKVIHDELTAVGVEVVSLELGTLVIKDNLIETSRIREIIRANGFELIEDNEAHVVEKIKLFLLGLVRHLPIQRKEKLSSLISAELNKDYSGLSRLFSQKEGITIEKYFLKLKLEKVKEMIQEGGQSFSEIAYYLDYANINHLSRQFKQTTGMSMSEYRQTMNFDRKPLDKIM